VNAGDGRRDDASEIPPARSNAIVGALTAALIVAAFLALGWRNSLPRSSFLYPNCTWENHVVSAIASFCFHGLAATHFLPDVCPPGDYRPGPCLYTHIPPFSEVFFGALHLLGVSSLHGLRWFSIALNVAALAVLFQAMALLKNRVFGLLMVAAILANPHFWMRAHGIYEYAFQLPHQSLLLLGLAMYAKNRSRWGVAAAFAGAFWQGTCAFVYQIATVFIILGFLLSDNRDKWRGYFLAALGGPAAFLAHFLQLVSLGSFAAAVHDLSSSFIERSAMLGDTVELVHYPTDGIYLARAAHVLSRDAGFGGWFFLPSALTIGLLALAAAQKQEVANRAAFIRGVFLFAGSLLWCLVMRDAFLHDPITFIQQLSLWVALSLAVPVYACGALVKKAWAGDRGAAPAAVAVGLAAAALCWLSAGDLRQYWESERALLTAPLETAGGMAESLMAVASAPGMIGVDYLALFNPAKGEKDKFRRRICTDADPPECRNPTVGLKFTYWKEVRPQRLALDFFCARPGDTRVAFYRIENTGKRGALLGETTAAGFANGVIDLPLPTPAAGRLFELEIGPAACEAFIIEKMTLE